MPDYFPRSPIQILRRLTVRHTLQVTSFGGSGTSMLYRFLEKRGCDVPQTFDKIPWKHQQAPPLSDQVPSGFRAIYVFSDPRNAVLSVFRRKYQHHHLVRMGEPKRKLGVPTHEPTCQPDYFKLRDLLDYGVDPFKLEDQFLNWTTSDREYPIMILRFRALWDHLTEFFAFSGLPTRYMSEFPERRERHSDWRDLEANEKKKINYIYGHVAKRIQSHTQFKIR